jgi:radical SAM superfamily enzyme YgiQ (UPF0313 family)
MLRFSVLGLTIVAGLTPSEHNVRIMDENVEPLDLDAPADLVGISFMTALAPRAYEIAAAFRRRGIPVVGGGYHATLYAADAAPHFDTLVLGDAEEVWPLLLADLQVRRLKPVYRSCPAAGAPLESPLPRRGLLEKTRRRYATIHAVQTARGCRHACRYCSVTAFHHAAHRRRRLESVLEELRSTPRCFIFVDDNIVASRDYARALFDALVPLRKLWVAQAPLELADDPELLALARRAGCRGLFIGVESTSQASLAGVGKEFNQAARHRERLAAIRRQGIAVIAGMIVGLDADPPAVFERNLHFLENNRIDALQLNILTPLPGTPLFDSMRAAGRMRDLDWSHYDFRHVVFEPRLMSRTDLQDGADWLYAQFYRLDRILLRALRTLLACGPAAAWLALRLNLTYRYDNLREGIRGRNPAVHSLDAAADTANRTLTALPLVHGGNATTE